MKDEERMICPRGRVSRLGRAPEDVAPVHPTSVLTPNSLTTPAHYSLQSTSETQANSGRYRIQGSHRNPDPKCGSVARALVK